MYKLGALATILPLLSLSTSSFLPSRPNLDNSPWVVYDAVCIRPTAGTYDMSDRHEFDFYDSPPKNNQTVPSHVTIDPEATKYPAGYTIGVFSLGYAEFDNGVNITYNLATPFSWMSVGGRNWTVVDTTPSQLTGPPLELYTAKDGYKCSSSYAAGPGAPGSRKLDVALTP